MQVRFLKSVSNVSKRLWEYLQYFAPDVSLPWLMFGDFHDMISSSEKLGGAAVSINRCLRFSNMMDVCGMVDLGFEGPAFTWTGGLLVFMRDWIELLGTRHGVFCFQRRR